MASHRDFEGQTKSVENGGIQTIPISRSLALSQAKSCQYSELTHDIKARWLREGATAVEGAIISLSNRRQASKMTNFTRIEISQYSWVIIVGVTTLQSINRRNFIPEL